MDEAVEGVIKKFGMSACEGTSKINVTEKVHNLLLCGLFLNKEMVLIRAMIGFNAEYGCVLKVGIRSLNATITSHMLECMD